MVVERRCHEDLFSAKLVVGIGESKPSVVCVPIELEKNLHFTRCRAALEILKTDVSAEEFVELMSYGVALGIIEIAVCSAVR